MQGISDGAKKDLGRDGVKTNLGHNCVISHCWFQSESKLR